MRIFVTGSTGFIGVPLVRQLAGQGYSVAALYRNESLRQRISHPYVHPCRGHVLERDCLKKGMDGCDAVIHLAAYARVWSKNPEDFYKINVDGTRYVLEQAIKAGVKRVVITSTAGVYGPSQDGSAVDETHTLPRVYFTEYERTKSLADQVAVSFLDQGLEIVFLHPTRVYGPGLLSESNSVTKLIIRFINGKWHIVPSNGKSIGNYVYIDDVVNAHIQALTKGRSGEHYLLGGENVSYNELFDRIREVSGWSSWLIHLPYSIMLSAAGIMELLSKVRLTSPPVTRGFVKKYNYNWIVSSHKAEQELGYRITPLGKGIAEILDWVRETEKNPTT